MPCAPTKLWPNFNSKQRYMGSTMMSSFDVEEPGPGNKYRQGLECFAFGT